MEQEVPTLRISPPLLNSANPWATTLEDLQALFACPSLGAITTRTTLVNGFKHDAAIHQYAFFDPGIHSSTGNEETDKSSLNTLGYCPIPLADYLSFIKTISDGVERSFRCGEGRKVLEESVSVIIIESS